MARKRSLKPEFHEDTTLANCDIEARYLYAGLWCYMDAQGLIEADARLIRCKVFPYDEITLEKVSKWLDQLVRNGRLILFHWQGKDLLYCPKFVEHQNIYSDEKKRFSVDPELLKSLSHNTPSRSGDRTETSVDRTGEVEEEVEVKVEEEEERNPVFDFEIPYANYPKRPGPRKGEGFKRLKRQIKTQEDYLEFCQAVQNYREDCERRNCEPQHIKQFVNFVGPDDTQPWREWIQIETVPAKEDVGERIKRAVTHYGYTNGEAAKEWLGEMTWQRVKTLGGWSHLCRMSEWDLNKALKGAS